MPENYISRPDIASDMEHAANNQFFHAEISEIQGTFGAPHVPIFIYNVSSLEFHEFRPPNHPHFTVPACPEGAEYILTGQIEHPFPQTDYDQNGARKVEYTDGYREATVMLSPQNPGKDQSWTTNDPLNVGGNLNDYGVFWSTHNPPLSEEVEAAKARMEKTYRAELNKMARIEAKNPEEALDRATDISRAAAKYFGESTSFYRSNLTPKDGGKKSCLACGELIQNKAIICRYCHAPQTQQEFNQWLARQPGIKESTVAPAPATVRVRKVTED